MFGAKNNSVVDAAKSLGVGLMVIWLLAEILGVRSILNNEIESNLTFYAISRALNAAVSMMQSAEISLFIGNIDIGEVLDPVNDAVERFSTVLTWATASLLVQKLIILLVGSGGFKVIATLAAVASLAVVAVSGGSSLAATRVRSVFFLFVWIKLAAVLSIWISISVAGQWIGQSLKAAEGDLLAFQVEASSLQSLVTGSFDPDPETSKILSEQRASAESSIDIAQRRILDMEAEISELRAQLNVAQPERTWKDRLWHPLGGDASPEIQSLESQLVAVQTEKETSEIELEAIRSDLECLDKQIAGETCEGVIGRFSAFKEGVENLVSKSPQLILSLLNVIAAVIFKNLLIPIALAFLTLKFGPNWVAGRMDPTPR